MPESSLRRAAWFAPVGVFLSVQLLSAQATAYVSLGSPNYAELDALFSAGLVSNAIVGQRPYSRSEFARMIASARAAVTSDPGRPTSAWAHHVLSRLEEAFAEELAPVSGSGSTMDPPVGRVRAVSVDLTYASSPGRAVPTLYADAEGPWVSRIDATVNPLLQGQEGRRWANGWTLGTEVELEARLGSSIAVSIRPRFSQFVRDGGPSEGDIDMQHLYLRGVWRGTSFEAGRLPLVSGQSATQATFLSGNARGLDMIRLSSSAPFRLPGPLSALGPMAVSALLADMGQDRDVPHSKLFFLRMSVRPVSALEIGTSLMNHQGGEGGPEASTWERIKDVFLWGQPGVASAPISDKMAGIDARVSFFSLGLDVYLEGATTDIVLARAGEMLWDEAAWVAGLRWTRSSPGGSTTVITAEGLRSGVRPYTHHQYTSGLTLDGRVLGLPAGPMATGFTGRVYQRHDNHGVGLNLAWTRYRGDTYRHNGLTLDDLRWDLESDEPDEVRWTAIATWMGRLPSQKLELELSVGYELVQRAAFYGHTRSNMMSQMRIVRR